MIIIDAVTPVSRVKTLTDELDGIQPGQSFVYANNDGKIVKHVLDMLMIDGYSEPINLVQSRFFVLSIPTEHAWIDKKILAALPCRRRDLMRRLHLSANQIDDAVERLGLVIVGGRPIVYKMP